MYHRHKPRIAARKRLKAAARLKEPRRIIDIVVNPGEQRTFAPAVRYRCSNIEVKDRRKHLKIKFIAGKLANRTAEDKVVWRSEWNKVVKWGVCRSDKEFVHTAPRRHSNRRTHAAHRSFVRDHTWQLWSYCSGCHCLFPKTHQLLNHRHTFRCGGQWNEFVALGPSKAIDQRVHRTGHCYWVMGEVYKPVEWKRQANGSKFSLDKPSLVDPNPAHHISLRRTLNPRIEKGSARIPGTVRPGRIPNVAGGEYCKSPNKWRRKCTASLLSSTTPARRLDRIALARERRKKSVQFSPSKLLSDHTLSALL